MYLFKNNATSTLRQDTPAASVSLTLPSGEGARFPAPVAPDLATVTIEDRRTGQLEICTMTARVADVLTVIRGQEGTVAQLFYAGATVSNRMTAGTLAGIQTLGTFFYAGPYTVAQPPGPAPGAIGDAGQIMPNPIPPGTQYYNVGQKTIYVWDGTQWIAYTGMLPLDGHLAMIGALQMGGNAILSQGSGDHVAIDGGGGHTNNLNIDGNANVVQTKRLTTHTTFPIAVPGQLVANIPDAQLAMGPGTAGPAVPLIAVRFFQTTSTYDIGDHVVNDGVLLRARVAISPGVFNGASWTSASGGIPEAPIDGTPYLRQSGNWVGPSTALVVTDAPNDGNEYVRQSLAWTLHDKTWAGITGKPATFPPSTHTHTISEVTNLQTTLDNDRAARVSGDAALQTQVTANANAITAEQTRAIADVDSEEAARIAADATLNTAISTEVTNRIADVNSEEAARIAADAALTTAVNGKVGPDAPSDGYQYARKDAAWTKVTGGALISATPPVSPLPSSFWWESDTGNLFIRFDDGNSAQWIQVNYSPLATDYVFRAGDTMTGPLVLSADPTLPLHAATKQYVDGNAVKSHRSGAGATALGTATWTRVNMATIGTQVGGWTLVSNNLVVPKTGLYMVGASAQITMPAAIGILEVGVAVNGGITAPFVHARAANQVATAYAWTLNCQTVVGLTAGDTLTMVAYSNPAGATVSDANDVTHLWATMLAAT
jgi:hypothetical protein